ncbi:protein phosphatase 2C domain-containing protein [Embleya sp. NBC_00896]|uniref:protein phosphatase 2C domain-containing protein n=1 Tax=Embleya sp. NBC_00896 TaxID=2975961 RepID=UPI00386F54FC|nr:protein phosphatase 2C domain-containing protein [Embleya sp. NBC_00896]
MGVIRVAGYGRLDATGPGGAPDGGEVAPPERDPTAGPAACPSCGLAADADDRYCESCGYDLDIPVPPVAERPPPRRVVTPSGHGPVCSACGTATIGSDGWCDACGRPFNPRDHVESDLGLVAMVSNRGLRHRRNEDSAALRVLRMPDGSDNVVAVVCDGVSSSPRPDEASATAAETACATMAATLVEGCGPAKATSAGVAAAASAVARMPGAEDAGNAPACTLVSAIMTPGEITVGWVGDSRAYWLADPDSGADDPADGDDTLPGASTLPPAPIDPQDPEQTEIRRTPSALLTEDDSWATRMIALGAMTEAEAYADRRAHAIVSWLGADAGEVRPRVTSVRPTGPGVLLLCSDGLWNYLSVASTLAAMVFPGGYDRPLDAARLLTGFALDRGGADNITVALIPFSPPGDPVRGPDHD